jgi:hypothetical protein
MRKLILASVSGIALLGLAACNENKTAGESAPATTETQPATPPATDPATPPAQPAEPPAQ